MLTNYRNHGDKLIGNIMGNGTNTEVLVSMNMGLKNPLDYHSIEKWEFDKDGNLIIDENEFNYQAIWKQHEHQSMGAFSSTIIRNINK